MDKFELEESGILRAVGYVDDGRSQQLYDSSAWMIRYKECYRNSVLVGIALKAGGQSERVRYVEGVCFGLVVFAHGWLEYDGKAVDVTAVKLGSGNDFYMPVYSWSMEEVISHVRDEGEFPIAEGQGSLRSHFWQAQMFLWEQLFSGGLNGKLQDGNF